MSNQSFKAQYSLPTSLVGEIEAARVRFNQENHQKLQKSDWVSKLLSEALKNYAKTTNSQNA
jgi:hypothetical protein